MKQSVRKEGRRNEEAEESSPFLAVQLYCYETYREQRERERGTSEEGVHLLGGVVGLILDRHRRTQPHHVFGRVRTHRVLEALRGEERLDCCHLRLKLEFLGREQVVLGEQEE